MTTLKVTIRCGSYETSYKHASWNPKLDERLLFAFVSDEVREVISDAVELAVVPETAKTPSVPTKPVAA